MPSIDPGPVGSEMVWVANGGAWAWRGTGRLSRATAKSGVTHPKVDFLVRARAMDIISFESKNFGSRSRWRQRESSLCLKAKADKCLRSRTGQSQVAIFLKNLDLMTLTRLV
jgi:hypothetical protein